jgi:hypothetical protein
VNSDDNGVIDMGKERAMLMMNGLVVSRAEDPPIVTDSNVPGRQFVTAKMRVDLDVVLVVDEPATAAVHSDQFGMRHLRALLDALPNCQYRDCKRPATQRRVGGLAALHYCDDHVEEGAVGFPDTAVVEEYPHAAATRHIEAVVLAYERDRTHPRDEVPAGLTDGAE